MQLIALDFGELEKIALNLHIGVLNDQFAYTNTPRKPSYLKNKGLRICTNGQFGQRAPTGTNSFFLATDTNKQRTIMNSKKNNITISDLAKALGTSSSTVSRALKNHPKISDSMKEKVREMAIKMGYVQSIRAAIQQSFNNNIVGILTPNLSETRFSLMVDAARKQLESEGYQVVIACSSESSEKEEELILLFESLNVKGLIVSLTHRNKNPEYLRAFINKTPTVLFHRISFEMPCKKIMVDHFQAGFRAVQHLLNNSSKKIAHIGGDISCPLTKQISTGYRTAIKNGGLTPIKNFEVFSDYLLDDIMKATEIIYGQQERPDAILVDDLPAAQKLISILQTRKINIPQDVAVIAIGDEKDYSYYSPSITTIQIPYSNVGKNAAKSLAEIIGSESASQNNDINVQPFHLNIRNSTLRS